MIVDPVGTTTTTSYDAPYRAITTEDHLGGETTSTPGIRGTVYLSWRPVDEVEGTYHYGYDRTHQLSSEQRTGSYAYHYTYDAVGNRLAMERDGGQVITYTYDAGDQLLPTEGGVASATVAVLGTSVAGACPEPVEAPYTRDALALQCHLGAGGFLFRQATVAVGSALRQAQDNRRGPGMRPTAGCSACRPRTAGAV